MLQPMEEMILPPKRQAVVDRLRRRIETYRRRQSECVPRFDQSFSGSCEQQNLETSALQKRFLEGKGKRQAKKTERKPDLPAISSNLHSSVHVSCQQKFGCGDYEPPPKVQCGGSASAGSGGSEGLTKFSVEIVQQLEFTTSAADSQPQQISTNVTVKALTNTVKTSGSPPPPQPPRVPSPLDCERECKAECKSEVADDEFVGLDECAAALERDAASAFPGLADLIGEDDGDDAFEYLITEISEYPELMKDFDLDAGKMNGGNGMGLEPPEGEPAPRPYGGGEMSPAAQTLKHMAEQHQQAAGGDWARYRGYGGYRPRPTPPTMEHLHMSQQQQLHLSQPHHNLQVSAAQHMQVSGSGSGHVSAAAQQGIYASFQPHGTPSPQHHQGSGCDTYSASQSQNMNFSPSMRPRPSGPTQQTSQGPGQPPPLGIAAAGISREQQAKMLQQQQQQMLRAQQQMRPPPPEYKARFAGAPAPRRAPPPRAFPPHSRQYPADWRHVMLPQQAARPQFNHHHQGFNMGNMGGMGNVSGVNVGGSMAQQQQQQQLQMQQARLQQQQQQLMQHQQQRASNQQPSMSHLIMQQNQMMSVQGQMPNIHMSQSQSMSMQQGIAAAGISREQQAKMLQQQQQQMLRAQQQMRPPPPEYKARFAGAPAPRRAPPPRAFPPHSRQYPADWRHVMLPQQAARPQFNHHHQGFNMGNMGGMGNVSGVNVGGSMAQQQQQQQLQMQQARLQQQQQQLMQHQQQRASNQQPSMSHLIMQQNQMMSVQGQMPNIHMSQSQSMSMQQGGLSHGLGMQPPTSHSLQNNLMPQNGNFLHSFGPTADFNLDFLDNMPSSDAGNMTAQELLNSLDNSFLNDIL